MFAVITTLSSFMTYHRVYFMTGVTSGAGTAFLSGALVLQRVRVAQSLVFFVVFCISLYYLAIKCRF